MNILIDTDATKDTSFTFFCFHPHACHSVFSRWLLQPPESFQCVHSKKKKWRGVVSGKSCFFAWECKKRKKKRPPEKLFRKLPLHLFGQGNWIKWHPLVMRVLWKWAQCDPSRNWEEGRNDVCMSPQGHHHGKSPFFQNKKRNTGYCNEAKLQWDKLKKPPKLCFRQLMNYRKLPLE